MASHRECPLNTEWDEDDPARLRLYISRDFWRYYDCDDGIRRRYNGRVTGITNNKLDIEYTDGGETGVVSEDELLGIFGLMKKQISQTNKRKRAQEERASRRARRR